VQATCNIKTLDNCLVPTRMAWVTFLFSRLLSVWFSLRQKLSKQKLPSNAFVRCLRKKLFPRHKTYRHIQGVRTT